ncbi:MAG: alpha/beta hydrolase fold protein [Polaromonas sp.]|nr:alpha/beta hydrolase fold protein [Polaromonas sp.]
MRGAFTGAAMHFAQLSSLQKNKPHMTEPSLNHVTCPDASGGHRMAYWQWGRPESSHVVLCVHGLSRQGRDFDVLARALCDAGQALPGGLRVICPDVAGRGESDWLKDPMGYQVPAYAGDMLVLLAQLQAQAPVTTLDWVGTSMGGLIGIVVATLPRQAAPGLPAFMASIPPVRRLVLNDVGPAIEWPAIVRIGAYLGQAGEFDSLQGAAAAMWAVSAGFGPHTPEQWLALSTHMVKPVSDAPGSKLRLHYDPAMGLPFRQATEAAMQQGEATLWQLYDGMSAETLLLRGADSDLLTRATAQAMTERGPRARLVEFAGVGHAPTLVADDQVAVVRDFLLS